MKLKSLVLFFAMTIFSHAMNEDIQEVKKDSLVYGLPKRVWKYIFENHCDGITRLNCLVVSKSFYECIKEIGIYKIAPEELFDGHIFNNNKETLRHLKLAPTHYEFNVPFFLENVLACENLQTFKIYYLVTDEYAGRIAEWLKTNPSLTSLMLPHCSITQTGAKALAEALEVNTKLKKLSLSCNEIGDEGSLFFAQMLKKNTSLKHLNLLSNNISPKGTNALTTALISHKSLLSLNLYGNKLDEKSAKNLGITLANKSPLKKLTLGGKGYLPYAHINNQSYPFGKEGDSIILKGLQNNTVFECLDFSCCPLDTYAVRILAEILKKNTTPLRSLCFYSNHLTEEGIQHIADGLTHNTTLNTFSLSCNNINALSAGKIFTSLWNNIPLRKLTLDSDFLDINAATSFATFLKKTTNLFSLKFTTQFSTTTLEIVAEGLGENKSITDLDLSNSTIPDGRAINLTQALENNQKITHLNLFNTKITDQGAYAFALLLAKNTPLKSLNLGKNQIRIATTDIIEALKENKTLTTLHLPTVDKNLSKFKSLFDLSLSHESLRVVTVDISYYGVLLYRKINEVLACDFKSLPYPKKTFHIFFYSYLFYKKGHLTKIAEEEIKQSIELLKKNRIRMYFQNID